MNAQWMIEEKEGQENELRAFVIHTKQLHIGILLPSRCLFLTFEAPLG